MSGGGPRWTGFRPAEISARINAPVVSIHAEDAAFLWLLRDRAAVAANYSLQNLADLDERIEAHLDGLRVAGPRGWQLAERQLEKGEAGEVFEATALSASADDGRLQRVVALAEGSPERERALVSALGWLEFQQVVNRIAAFLHDGAPVERRLGLGAAVAHRRDPGAPLVDALDAGDVSLRARALGALGQLGSRHLAERAFAALRDPDPDCAFWGAWSAAVLGDRGADVLGALEQVASSDSRHADRAADLVARCLEQSDADRWLKGLLANGQRRTFAIGARALGDAAKIPTLLELTRDEADARIAGEAVSAIAGIDLEYLDLDRPPDDVEGEAAPKPAGDDALPLPDPERLGQWWADQGAELPRGRCLQGTVMTQAALSAALKKGNQRVRASAALELALRSPGTPVYETRAPGWRQQAELGP